MGLFSVDWVSAISAAPHHTLHLGLAAARELLREIASTLGAYLTGQLKISLILTAIFAIGFALAGMPWWGLVAFLCGFLHLVPVFGTLLSLGLAELVMVSAEQSWNRCLVVLAIWVAGEALESFWLTPRILGRRLQLSPWVVFLAVALGGMIFGPLGVLLAVPVAAVLAVIYRAWLRQRRAT